MRQHSQGPGPRAAEVSTGSRKTRVPAGSSSQASSSAPTTSCPGTNGHDTKGEKYSDDRPVTVARSEPQMPDSRTRPRPGGPPGGPDGAVAPPLDRPARLAGQPQQGEVGVGRPRMADRAQHRQI